MTQNPKQLIICCDNLGSSHAANEAVMHILKKGTASDASLMVPCPWARSVAALYKNQKLGVQLTLNAPYLDYRWGPITHAPSLLDGDGGFPRSLEDLWEHADLEEVWKECHAQINRAVLWGFEITHLGSYMNALLPSAGFFDVYLELAKEFDLPIRLSDPETEKQYGFPIRELADAAGVKYVERVITFQHPSSENWMKALESLPVGASEMLIPPAIDTPELRAIDSKWERLTEGYELLSGVDLENIKSMGIEIVSWSTLK